MAPPVAITKGTDASEIKISEAGDSVAAAQEARRLSVAAGFATEGGEEIALAAMELATNLLKHAGKGTMKLSTVASGERIGIEIEARDLGPGIADIEQAFEDGYSTAGSLGYGMGTVNRLADEIEVSSTMDSGTVIVCRRWVKSTQPEEMQHPWDVGVFTRSRNGARENGDAFVVKHWEEQLLVGLIDGLGHGEPAQRAALAAQRYVQTHYDQPIEKIFQGAGRACRGTRGVVMSLARFSRSTSFEWASVGNVEVRALSGGKKIPFLLKRGILGVDDARAHVQSLEWDPSWTLVLHTDGLRTHWQWSDFPGLETQHPRVIATKLMKELASGNDDATVLVVRGAAL